MLMLSGFAKAPNPNNIGQVDIYKVRSELLMDATNYAGVFTPKEAATVWAKGLEHRSAAMQYTVMTDKLKKQYADGLDEWKSNWVAGQSSPSVLSFTITDITRPDDTHAIINLKFEVGCPSCTSKYYNATLWLVREQEFWRIENLSTDKELYTYTLFENK